MASNALDHGTCTMRCSVEKRSMCRDLQKWSKTLLCMIGLENVAERLVGRKKHQHRHQSQQQQQQPQAGLLFLSSSQSNCTQPEHQTASTSADEAKSLLPHDWDPKDRCAICTQIAEKEELAKKAQAAAHQHSKSKKELRANSDRSKEGEGKSANRTETSSMSSSQSAGSGQQANSKQHQQQQQQQQQMQHVIDWRSMNGSGSSASSTHNVFGAMNMFRAASSTTAQSNSSSPFGSTGSLAAASMFSPTGYPFFDLNQVYLNELLNHYNKVAAAAVAGGSSGSSSSYNMMSPLSMGVASMPPPLPYSVNTAAAAFAFPHLMANLGGTQATSSTSSSSNQATTSSAAAVGVSSSTSASTGDEPLDLSSKKPITSSKKCSAPGHCSSGETSKGGSSAAPVAPSQSPLESSGSKGPASTTSSNCSSASNANVSNNNNKRAYSQMDLQKAVDDIRSKKLGTRRASVVYGIPRSTLRNKIYKLEATDDDQSQPPPSSVSTSKTSGRKGEKSKPIVTDSNLIRLEENRTTTADDMVQDAMDAVCGGRTTTSSEDSSSGSLTSTSSSASSSTCPNDLSAFGFVDAYNGTWTTSAAATLTAELAKRQAVEALWRSTSTNGATRSAFNAEITAFTSPIINGNAAIKSALQEAVCCALTENLKLKCSTPGDSSDHVPSPVSFVSKSMKSSGKRSSSSRRRGSKGAGGGGGCGMSTALAGSPPATMVKIDRPDQASSTGGASSNADDPNDPSKKIRPKRGQYRKYDKNALAEAVHAVRRGEMSVHRAGSFYGVPHSTLEYKVKERNLLRPKKRDLKKKLDGEAGLSGGTNGDSATVPTASASAAVDSADTPAAEDCTNTSTTPKLAELPTSDEKSPVSAPTPMTTTKSKSSSSRSTKSKRSKRPSQATTTTASAEPPSSPNPAASSCSPLSSDIFNSLIHSASTPVSSDLSTGEPSPKKKKGANNPSSVSPSPVSSPSISAPVAASNTTAEEGTSSSMTIGTAGADGQSSSEIDQAATADGDEKSEYSTLKAYEAGFQAALLASDILHRLQMQQTYSSTSNENEEEDTPMAPRDESSNGEAKTPQGNQLTAKSE